VVCLIRVNDSENRVKSYGTGFLIYAIHHLYLIIILGLYQGIEEQYDAELKVVLIIPVVIYR